jgi:hypothetical protein
MDPMSSQWDNLHEGRKGFFVKDKIISNIPNSPSSCGILLCFQRSQLASSHYDFKPFVTETILMIAAINCFLPFYRASRTFYVFVFLESIAL